MKIPSISLLVFIGIAANKLTNTPIAHAFTQHASSISIVSQIHNGSIGSNKNNIKSSSLPKLSIFRGQGKQGLSFLQSSTSATIDDGNNHGIQIKETKSKLNKEFFSIAVPAFIQLAAEPLASLVDTAYLGRMGPEVLGGAGVAISAQYAVSKLYNDPLLRTSISLVASQDGKARGNQASDTGNSESERKSAKKDLSIAVSSALLLALSVGVIQLVIYASLASGIIKGMG
jgi:hypothetical protein